MMQTPNELLPDGLQMDLLWTNASPTSEFNTQTIDLDLSKYEFVYIDFARNSDGFSYNFSKLSKVYKNDDVVFDMAVIYYNETVGYVFRHYAVRLGGIDFKNGLSGTPLPENPNNYAMIPYRIYGVK